MVTGRLGSQFAGLGNFALGAGEQLAGQTWPTSWVQGFKLTKRNFSKIVYNRFFTYKMTPRTFSFQINRKNRATLTTSPSYTEIGRGETVKWTFDFTNVLLPGETISSTPTYVVYLYRQNITIPNVTSSVTFSGASTTVNVAGSALNLGGKYTIVCSIPLSSSRIEEGILDFSVPV